ncbi:MAG: hypothetical protein AAGE88_18100 [Actinomycetota bacterium]
MTTTWRIRSERTEPRYRVTEGAALALARSMTRRFHCTFTVDHRTDVGGRWTKRHEIKPSEQEATTP